MTLDFQDFLGFFQERLTLCLVLRYRLGSDWWVWKLRSAGSAGRNEAMVLWQMADSADCRRQLQKLPLAIIA